MSLDVWLMSDEPTAIAPSAGTGIFVRENGFNREITREEWDEKFPGREPVMAKVAQSPCEVYEANITHNLGKMADEAGVYEYLWRPEEVGCDRASDLIDHLEAGLNTLKSDPVKLKAFNPSNGWGDYDGLVKFVEEYLAACRKYPTAKIYASR